MAHLTPKSSPHSTRSPLLPCGCPVDCRCLHRDTHTGQYYPSPASDVNRPLPTHNTPVLPDMYQLLTPNSDNRPLPRHDKPSADLLLHPLLAYRPGAQTLVIYNVIHPPSSIHHSSQTPFSEFSRPATVPSTRRLRLVSDRLPWAIDISNPSSIGPITVMQVFDAIYAALQHSVTTTEWRIASSSQKEKFADAHRRRREVAKDPKKETALGVKRVDWLVNRVMFKGLRKDEAEIIRILDNNPDEHLSYTLILEMGA